MQNNIWLAMYNKMNISVKGILLKWTFLLIIYLRGKNSEEHIEADGDCIRDVLDSRYARTGMNLLRICDHVYIYRCMNVHNVPSNYLIFPP